MNQYVLIFNFKQYLLYDKLIITVNYLITDYYIFINKILLIINNNIIMIGNPYIKGLLFLFNKISINKKLMHTIKFKKRKRYLKIIPYYNYKVDYKLLKIFLISNGKKKIS